MVFMMRMEKPQNRGDQSGFSLIEVAIALMILGIMMVPLIQQYNIYQINKVYKTSSENVAVVRSALQKYAINYGRYPLPSPKNIGTGAAGYGAEVAGPVVTPCPSTSVCRTTTGSLGSAGVLIGTVPFATLGLPESYTLDGYGRKFTYAVTEALTVSATFSDTGGVIRLLDNGGGNHTGTTNNLQFALVSHGLNGKGAGTISGAAPIACTGAGRDIENCNGDAIFTSNYATINTGAAAIYARLSMDSAGANYYDDFVEYTLSTTTDIWTLNATAAAPDVYQRGLTGNIRIGSWPTAGAVPLAAQIQPSAKVDVAGDAAKPGNVRADKLSTNRLCTFAEGASYVGCTAATTGTPAGKVFAPVIIGGDINQEDTPETTGYGIHCGLKGLTGIQFADEQCNFNSYPPAAITIDSGCTGIAGGRTITSGKLSCFTN